MANRPLGEVVRRLRSLLGPDGDALSDSQLLQCFVADGDQDAFTEVMRRHGPMVLGVCRRVLADTHAAEDAFQAVFLVLARRAAAVPWRESLGGWLHGVARRVALRAKAQMLRKPSPEHLHSAPSIDPVEEAAVRELRRVVDQELQALPAKYRGPLVLCDLEGKTHEEAARELGWPRGSLAKRLQGARQQMRARLLRRGVDLSASAALPMGVNLTAVVSAELAEAAVGAPGSASSAVAALAKGVVQAMWWKKMTTVMLTLVLIGTGIGAAALAYRASAAPVPVKPGKAPEDKPAARKESKAVIEKGVEFRAYVEGQCPAPPVGESRRLDLGLRITNTTDKPITFALMDTVWLVLETADGKALRMGGGRDKTRPYPPITIAAGKSADVSRAGSLEWSKDGKELRLGGMDPSGFFWFFEGLRPGKYVLSIRYENKDAGAFWTGKAITQGVELEILEARNASRPVRVEGLELAALAPARVVVPRPGSSVDFDMGLRIVNVSEKPVVIAVSDVIHLWLINAEGRKVGMNLGRNGLPRPLLPVTLAHGRAWTWQPEARLARVGGDRTTLQLSGPDGRGVPGLWFFSTLKQKKYRLTIEYANSNAKQDDVPLWVGKAKTEEVDFEIVGR